MISTIRFLKPNRYRHDVGSIDTEMGYGVHLALVQRGIAEFVHKAPDAEVEPEPARERKTRRSFTKES